MIYISVYHSRPVILLRLGLCSQSALKEKTPLSASKYWLSAQTYSLLISKLYLNCAHGFRIWIYIICM